MDWDAVPELQREGYVMAWNGMESSRVSCRDVSRRVESNKAPSGSLSTVAYMVIVVHCIALLFVTSKSTFLVVLERR